MGINQATALRYEQRETEDKITLETLSKVAEAMDCKLVYAIVPREPHKNLKDILNKHASELALDILKRTEHTMKLEIQGTGLSKLDAENLAEELVENVDGRIWDREKHGRD